MLLYKTRALGAAFLAIILLGAVSCKNTENKNGDFVRIKFDEDGVDLAMKHDFIKTRDLILNDVPRDRLEKARSEMMSIYSSMARTSALSWQERGPNNIAGRTRSIIVDKRDQSGNTVFAGSVGGGIFKTTNFTSNSVTWSPVNDQLTNLAINALIQDNANPLIMYAGTGEGWFNTDAIRGAGIFKSTDGGTTWAIIPSTSTFEFVQDLVIDNSGNLYASLRNQSSANRGVVRSTNGGTTWTQVLGSPLPGFTTSRAADLEVASNGDIYATLGIFGKSVIMKSSFSINGANTGALNTWQEITPLHLVTTYRAELAVAPSNPQRVYVLLQDSSNSQVSKIFRSNNAGTTWDSLPAPAALNNGAVSQTWFNLIAAVDPSNADVLIVGGFRLAKSTDAGGNWTTIGTTIHVDQHMLVYLESSKVIVGNDGGVFYSANANAASPAFVNKNNGYNVTQFYSCDYHPTNENYFLAGAQDNNTQKFTVSGINTTSAVSGGDGGFAHIDQTDGLIQISSATNNQYFRSTNGGLSFSFLSSVSNERGQFINATDYDDKHNILYAGDDAGKYYVISRLDSVPVGLEQQITAMGARRLTAVKADPFTDNTIWIGASLGGSLPQILKISNANTTPVVEVNTTLPGSFSNAYIASIDVDPANANHILVSLSNYGVISVYESTNGGTSWTSIEGNLPDMPVHWAIFAPATAQLNGTMGGNGGILLATELGVWTTSQSNGAATQWMPNNSGGLPNVRTDMLKYRPQNNMLVAATHGRGLYTTILPSTATSVNVVTNTKGFISYISATPHQLFIKTGNLIGVKKITVNLIDASGRIVLTNHSDYSSKFVSVSSLPPGMYVLKIYGDRKETFTRQFVK